MNSLGGLTRSLQWISNVDLHVEKLSFKVSKVSFHLNKGIKPSFPWHNIYIHLLNVDIHCNNSMEGNVNILEIPKIEGYHLVGISMRVE